MDGSALNSAIPAIDAIISVYETTSLNITQRLIDANPNIIDPIAIWHDFGSISPNSTDDLKLVSLKKRSLQKRGSSTVSTSIGVGSYQINLGQYFVGTLDYTINSGGLVDVLVLENSYVTSCKYGNSVCSYISSCSCLSIPTCSKRCTGLDISNSYSILILRYNAPTVTVSASYTYTRSASSTPTSLDVYSSGTNIYAQIAVPIFIVIVVGSLIFKYYQFRRRNNGIDPVYPSANDQSQMQIHYIKPEQPPACIPIQTASYGNYTSDASPTYSSVVPVYAGNQTLANQPYNSQINTQPYNPHGNTRYTDNISGSAPPLNQNDYRGTINTVAPLDRNEYQ